MVSACIERLREQRLADDSAFATFWVDQRQSHNPRSRAALRHELRSKGIRGEIAEAGLESCDDRTAATSAARRYLHRVEGIDRTTALRRLAGYLVRRGFSHGLAAHVAAGLL
ncbi:MAG: regulatory protein RecX [Chloroflexota bacterium]